jgi:hypothetical protein
MVGSPEMSYTIFDIVMSMNATVIPRFTLKNIQNHQNVYPHYHVFKPSSLPHMNVLPINRNRRTPTRT